MRLRLPRKEESQNGKKHPIQIQNTNSLLRVEVHSQASSQALQFETNLTGSESQLAGGKPVRYIQAQPRS